MFRLIRTKVSLLGILAFTIAVSWYLYVKANDTQKPIFNSNSSFYTPGQHNNCKWVVHISNKITTEPGDNSPVQIGIPDVIKDGYIAGTMQNGPGNSLLFAFKLPTQKNESPPIVMTASYKESELPLTKVRFRVFNSTLLSMVLYSTYESCVEATME
jgi:hypothetical protein